MSDQGIPVQAVINQLLSRISQLEFENAVLRAQLAPEEAPSINGVIPEARAEEAANERFR